MMDCLAIMAAGKSSRFGGFPKAFCDLGGRKNVENTIELATKHFRRIYLVVNRETFASGVTAGLNAEIISIVTGQGDADSILKAFQKIASDRPADTIAACWGDAVFANDEPFVELQVGLSGWSPGSPVLVGCSVDDEPYAWFDVDGKSITSSHFKKKEPDACPKGLHDQSVFAFRAEVLTDYLTRRKHDLGLDRFDENTYDASRGEMGLLDAFTWFYDQPDMLPAEYCDVAPGNVLSFNTPEELGAVIEQMKKYNNGRKCIPC